MKQRIAIVADGVSGSYLSQKWLEWGFDVTLIEVASPLAFPPAETEWVYHGNGECFEKGGLVYGPELRDLYWSLSKETHECLASWLKKLGAEFSRSQLWWLGKSEDEIQQLKKSETQTSRFLSAPDTLAELPYQGALEEDCLRFNRASVQEAALEKLKEYERFRFLPGCSLPSIATTDKMGVEIKVKQEVLQFDFAFWLCPQAPDFETLKDTYIPVTLNSFRYPQGGTIPDAEAFIFHLGADYCLKELGGLRVGSFRSLFSDGSVGLKQEVDAVSQSHLEKFFTSMNWIDSESSQVFANLTAVTCDGLPIVGPISGAPNVVFVGGFAARESNLIYAILDRVSKGVREDGKYEGLEPFSPRRFLQ